MTKKQRTAEAVSRLKKKYPDAICSLQYADPFRLLVAVRLSAQCTDARVNLVTPALFARFPSMQAFAAATPEEVEPYIHSCGFFRAKAKDIVNAAKMLLDEYGGELPKTVDELCKLPGVGRKTANLLCGDIFGLGGVVVADTHCIRISGRLGLVDSKDPFKVEMQLRKLLPPEESNDFCHRLVLFGREVCDARAPRCTQCPLSDICPRVGVKTPQKGA